MKYLLFIILLVAFLITAGCVGGNQNSAVTPTQSTATSSDPIIGIWQWTTTDSTKLYTFSFFSDGRYSFTDSSDPNTLPGTWSKVRENRYLIAYTSGKNQDLVFNPVTDTFTMPEFSQVLAYRLGKEPVGTFTSTVPPTPVVTSTVPTIQIFQPVETTPLPPTTVATTPSWLSPTPIHFTPKFNFSQTLGGVTPTPTLVTPTPTLVTPYATAGYLTVQTPVITTPPTWVIKLISGPTPPYTIRPYYPPPLTITNPRLPICKIVSSNMNPVYSSVNDYRVQWAISGFASNTGATGTCIITVNNYEQSLYISSGETQHFSFIFSPSTIAVYQISIR